MRIIHKGALRITVRTGRSMIRTSAHFGLAVLITIAPLFCCCTVRHLFHPKFTYSRPADRISTSPGSTCCTKLAKTCCHEPVRESPPPSPVPQPCACCTDRPDIAQPENKVALEMPQRTSERLPPAAVALAVGCPEHLALHGGLDPPQRFEVDACYESLYRRHVLRC